MEWYLLLIQKYGYLGILLGTLLEGEIFLALGGVFARQGLMNMWIVIIMAMAGSFISHSLFYFLGRWRGVAVVQRFPRLQSGYPKAHALAQRFGPACILIVQFLYGMRLVTCLVLGTLRFRTGPFIVWQLLACSIWALGMAAAGYVFGTAIQYLVSRLEIVLTVSIAVVIALLLAYRWFWAWTERQAENTTPCSRPNLCSELATRILPGAHNPVIVDIPQRSPVRNAKKIPGLP
jgi:membrane protein DedA with SNARE-associated domain